MSLSTHVLDTSRGEPAAGVPVALLRHEAGQWLVIASGVTNADGRLERWVGDWRPGRYRLAFDVTAYRGADAFFPAIDVEFAVTDADRRTHVPLLLSDFGYTTYRGL